MELNVPIVASFEALEKLPGSEEEINDCIIGWDELEQYGLGSGMRGFDKVFTMFNPVIYRQNLGIESDDDSVSIHLSPENWELRLGWNAENHSFYKISKTIYIFGSNQATYLPKGFINTINQCASAGCHFILSDNPGTDQLVQDYLKSIDFKEVELYISGEDASDCRKNAGDWPVHVIPPEELVYNDFVYDKCKKALMDAHDEYIALTVADDDPSYWSIQGPIFYYESVGHVYHAEAGEVSIIDGNGEKRLLQGPLCVTTPNGGKVYIAANPNEDLICRVKTEPEPGYKIELGKTMWGYTNRTVSTECGDYDILIHGEDWEKCKEQYPQQFPPFTRPLWEEDAVRLPISSLNGPSIALSLEGLQALTELAFLVRKQDCISPIMVTRVPGEKYEVVAGQRRLLACIIAGFDTVPCRIIEKKES